MSEYTYKNIHKENRVWAWKKCACFCLHNREQSTMRIRFVNGKKLLDTANVLPKKFKLAFALRCLLLENMFCIDVFSFWNAHVWATNKGYSIHTYKMWVYSNPFWVNDIFSISILNWCTKPAETKSPFQWK